MKRTAYGGWDNCYRLENPRVELIVTADVGPRIIRFGLRGGENVLKEFPEQMGTTGGSTWSSYGGHRLWHAPEASPRTYQPDGEPLKIEEIAGGLKALPKTEAATGIRKEIEVRLASDSTHVQLTHRLVNDGLWEIRLAPWAITVMKTGGRAILPLPPKGSHPRDLTPRDRLVLWAYTDMADPRWTWGSRYLFLRQDPARPAPQKIGIASSEGWLGYWNAGLFFVKFHPAPSAAEYPDMGANVEVFTNPEILELETLGPLAPLAPGAAAEHVEHWFLFEEPTAPETEADVTERILPHVRKAQGILGAGKIG